jgi:acyl-CoA synthetase (NDP forming)
MGFKGQVYPVNAREKEVLGLTCYPSLVDIPGRVDLVIITVPTAGVRQVIVDCLNKGVGAAVIITAGFSEFGSEGALIEREVADLARSGGLALVGPNCAGVVSTHADLYANMMPVYPGKGNIAIISQSGSVADMIAIQVCDRGMGISSLISVGNEATLHIEDFLEYLGSDPGTNLITLYVEGFRGGRRFLEVAGKVTARKPVIMLKAGSSPAGARAARSHTAALAGSDGVIDSMLKQAGIIRVQTMDELVDAALAFSNQPLPRGNRVGIISPGGGWGVMMADACTQEGMDVASLDQGTIAKLNAELPPFWSHANPVDTLTGAAGDPVKIVQAMLESPGVDGLIVLGMVGGVGPVFQQLHGKGGEKGADFAANSSGHFKSYFRSMVELKDRYTRPVIITLSLPISSGTVLETAAAVTRETGTACYTSFVQASRAYAALSRYAEYLRRLR